MEHEKFELDYTSNSAFVARCEVDIYKGLGSYNRLAVVILTEIAENKGKSVTNAFEHIATKIVHQKRLNPHRVLWIEHYPDRNTREMTLPILNESYSLVSLDWVALKVARAPGWNHITREWLERLLGKEFWR